MKKEEKKSSLKTEQEATQELADSIRTYYTKEINDKIDEMSVKQMSAILKDFAGTDYWIAMLKYTSLRQPQVDSIFRMANPYTEQHKISQAQGILIGMSDVPSFVIELNSKPVKGEEKEGPGGTII